MSTDTPLNTATDHEGHAKSARWLRFLPRWSLAAGLFTIALPITILGAIGFKATDSALGADYIELLQAVRTPAMFRLGWTIDAIIWLLIGGSLLILGGILQDRAPIAGTFVCVSGVAQLIGFLGALIRLFGTTDLAVAYTSAAPDQQLTILNSYLNMWRIISSHFYAAVLFSGLGYLIAAQNFISLRGFPRWLAIWLALPGCLGLAQFFIVSFGLPKLDILNYIGVGLGNIALNFAIAGALWRPSSELISTVSGEIQNDFS